MTVFAVLQNIETNQPIKYYNNPQDLPVALSDPIETTPYPALDPTKEVLYIVHEVFPDGNDFDQRVWASQDVIDLTSDPHPVWTNYPTMRVTWNKVMLTKQEIKDNATQILRSKTRERKQLLVFLQIPEVQEALGDVFDGIVVKKLFTGVSLTNRETKVVNAVQKIGDAARDDLANLFAIFQQIDNDEPFDLDANWADTEITQI